MGGLSIGLSIFIVIIMLGLLVTVHELGHFWVAKLLGIKAYEVSIFVGPQLFHWKGKDGVEYSIRAIPIGAYVRFTDIDEEGNVIESDDPDLLINNPRWKRLIVSIAGPLMNFLLGTLILFGLFSIVSYPTLDLMPAPMGSQLYNTDYQPFDTIVAVDGKTVFTSFLSVAVSSISTIVGSVVLSQTSLRSRRELQDLKSSARWRRTVLSSSVQRRKLPSLSSNLQSLSRTSAVSLA